MTRHDIHRDSEIIPADYEYLFSYATGGGNEPGFNMGLMRATIHGSATYTEVFFGAFGVYVSPEMKNPYGKLNYFSPPNGGCAICGTHYMYGDVWRHRATGECIRIGNVCADKYGMLTDRSELERYRKELAERRKVGRDRKARRAALRAYAVANPDVMAHLKTDHEITRDIRAKLIRRPLNGLSEGQVQLLEKLTTQVAEREAERKERQLTAAPVITGTVVVTGTVLCTKYQESQYGTTFKMMVQDERGFRVWGTVPAAIDDVERGDRVTFTATVQASPDDETFGFYKRPRKAQVHLDEQPLDAVKAAHEMLLEAARANTGNLDSDTMTLVCHVLGHLQGRVNRIERNN